MKILFENDDFFAVEKPNGIPTLKGKVSPSFAELIEKKYPEQKNIPESGIVHRLDNEVSGLVLIAKTNDAYKTLRKMFSDGKVLKEYTILVNGFTKESGTINISLSKKSSKKVTVDKFGLKASTEFKTLGHFLLHSDQKTIPCSLVIAESSSGKRHQIRIHFSHIGHPVISDQIYDKKHFDILPRIFFHASSIEFTWLNKKIKISSKLPKDLDQIKSSLIKRI